MSELTRYLSAQIDEHADNLRATLRAADANIAGAEALAMALQSQGIPAVACGRFHKGAYLVLWIGVGPVSLERMERALLRMDAIETARYPLRNETELRLAGHDYPIYVRTTVHEEPACAP